jgi:hypothetical protein
MHQTVLTSEKVDLQILQELNDIEEENSELSLFDFVTGLFDSKEFNAISMIVNRLTKMHHYISCVAAEEDINAEEIARLLINHV